MAYHDDNNNNENNNTNDNQCMVNMNAHLYWACVRVIDLSYLKAAPGRPCLWAFSEK